MSLRSAAATGLRTLRARQLQAASAARRCMSAEAPEQPAPKAMTLDEAIEIDARAADIFNSSPSAFVNMPASEMSIVVGERYDGSKAPNLIFEGRSNSGVRHSAPFAAAGFCRFSKLGDYGTTKKFGATSFTVDSLEEAQMEVSFTDLPLNEQAGRNELMEEYFAWLDAVKEKYIEHLRTHVDAYPALEKKYKYLLGKPGSEELLGDAISSEFNRVYNSYENRDGVTERTVNLKQKIYSRISKNMDKVFTSCEEDEKMKEEGMYRRYFPLYDAASKKVPVDKQYIYKGDVISAEITLDCMLYTVGNNVGFGLRKQPNSVTKLRRGVSKPRQNTKTTANAPLGNLEAAI